jgi:transposase
MAIYCGVDFHARQQTICYCDTADGEVQLKELDHEADDIRGFYAGLVGEVTVGIEASGYSTWFVELVESLGHRVLIGDAAEIRRLAKRRQKNDRRDATPILDLLLKGEFPQVHRPAFESREVLRLLRYRHKLVQMRTRAKNSLQALAFSAGAAGRSRLLNREGRERFLRLPMSEAMARQRQEWLSLVDEFNTRIKSLDVWLEQQARLGPHAEVVPGAVHQHDWRSRPRLLVVDVRAVRLEMSHAAPFVQRNVARIYQALDFRATLC